MGGGRESETMRERESGGIGVSFIHIIYQKLEYYCMKVSIVGGSSELLPLDPSLQVIGNQENNPKIKKMHILKKEKNLNVRVL